MPETVAEHPTSHTGRYLKKVLEQLRLRWWQLEWGIEGGLGGVGEEVGVAWELATGRYLKQVLEQHPPQPVAA